MKSAHIASASEVVEAASVPEAVSEAVWEGLEEMARRVGTSQSTVVLTRRDDEADEGASDYTFTAVAARLVFDYGDADEGSYTVENVHSVGRFDGVRFSDDLEADGDVSLMALNDGAVLDKDVSAFRFGLNEGVTVEPMTRVVLRIGDHELRTEFEGTGHELPPALRGRLYRETFPRLERFVAYLDQGEDIYERRPSGATFEDDGDTTGVERLDDEPTAGMVINGETFVESELTDIHPDGYSTPWASYSGEDAVEAVAKANVLPPLTTKQEPPSFGRIHHETAVEGEPTRVATDLPTDIYGDSDDQ